MVITNNRPQIEQCDVRPVASVIGFEHIFCNSIVSHLPQSVGFLKITRNDILVGSIFKAYLTQTCLVTAMPGIEVTNRPLGFPIIVACISHL